MGPLPAVGFRGGSSDLKVAVRSQNREACDEPPPTPSVVQLSSREGMLEGGRQLVAVGMGPGLGEPARGISWRA